MQHARGMKRSRKPTYESIVLDLHDYFQVLIQDGEPDGRRATAAATIARTLLLAMERKEFAAGTDKYSNMTEKELYEAAEKASGGRLKAVG